MEMFLALKGKVIIIKIQSNAIVSGYGPIRPEILKGQLPRANSVAKSLASSKFIVGHSTCCHIIKPYLETKANQKITTQTAPTSSTVPDFSHFASAHFRLLPPQTENLAQLFTCLQPA